MSRDKTKKHGDESSPVELVRQLAEIVEERGLSELIYDSESLTLTMRRGGVTAVSAMPVQPMVHHAPAPMQIAAPAAAPSEARDGGRDAASIGNGQHVVTSPFVGTFYRSPNPDSPAYVEVGQRVEKGQVLCIIEAMKLMNEIEADQSGVVAACLVNNADTVEYGQALFKIAPA